MGRMEYRLDPNQVLLYIYGIPVWDNFWGSQTVKIPLQGLSPQFATTWIPDRRLVPG